MVRKVETQFYVAQVGLELTMSLDALVSAWDCRCVLLRLVNSKLLFFLAVSGFLVVAASFLGLLG